MALTELGRHFQRLGTFLEAHQALWRPRPFTCLQCPWEAEYPALAAWLRARSLEQAEAGQASPYELPAPAPYLQWAAQARALCDVAPLQPVALAPAAAHAAVGVPGRKWQQIEAFASHLSLAERPAHWLDWCAGKGRLARRLIQPGQQATCLEHDPALVAAGERLSLRQPLPVRHVTQDVMATSAAAQLGPAHTVVALHACGDLHVRLMTLAAQAGCRQLAIAPCCYNRTGDEHYRPLSPEGAASGLRLDRHDLALPATEAVTAGRRERRLRDTSMARRLGFDLWQRVLRGENSYLPTPPVPSHWQAKPMRQWCLDMAALKHLDVPVEPAWEQLEQHGWQRLAQVRNLELVRNLFRRPLELWLVLDRALYLEHAGYQVRLGTFCAPALTPRNLLILAEQLSPKRGDNVVGSLV